MSGRGLGHTGGTLDKLESIPGFRVELTIDEFVAQVRDVGLAIIGQTADLVPADKLALRAPRRDRDGRPGLADRGLDHVEEARRRRAGDRARREGRRRRVHEDARRRAAPRRGDAQRSASEAGREVVCLLTDMDQPLGAAVGNALEVREALDDRARPRAGRLHRARARGVRAAARALRPRDRRRPRAGAAREARDRRRLGRGDLAPLDRGAGRDRRRGRARDARRSSARSTAPRAGVVDAARRDRGRQRRAPPRRRPAHEGRRDRPRGRRRLPAQARRRGRGGRRRSPRCTRATSSRPPTRSPRSRPPTSSATSRSPAPAGAARGRRLARGRAATVPELPEVETVRRRLAPRPRRAAARAGRDRRRAAHAAVRRRTPSRASSRASESRAVERRGKYLIVRFESGRALLIHLRMTGSLRHAPAGTLPDDPVPARGCQVRRRIGRRLPRRPPVRHVAPPRAGRGRAVPRRARRARSRSRRRSARATSRRGSRGRRAPVKAAILDQRTVAGVGNIYADEALWRARIHPLRAGGRARHRDEVRALHRGDPPRARARDRAAGRDAPRLRAPGRRARRDAGRVQGLRPRRRAVPALRHADREDRRRGPRHVVLPALPAARREPFGRRSRLAAMGSARTRPRRSCCARCASPRPTGSCTSTRSSAAGSARSRRASRKTKSRFGARLEPLSHVELMLHEGSGELQTVTGVELVRSHHAAREDGYRLQVGLIGAEAMLRLFVEPEANRARVHGAHAVPRRARRGARRPARRPAGARPARARVPAQAALGLRLPAAPDELRRVRRAPTSSASRRARAAPSAASTRAARSRSRPRASRASSGCSRRRSPTRAASS